MGFLGVNIDVCCGLKVDFVNILKWVLKFVGKVVERKGFRNIIICLNVNFCCG